ncbi:putative P-loop containing nucleoside triphosphate hydrolase [Helianthus annuus]|nr:putative P-loop containing nucleoside triphosphate hydrolase [Helianthus annuus]
MVDVDMVFILIRRREAHMYNTPNDHVTRDIREGIAKLGYLRFKVLGSAGLEAEVSSGSVLGRTAEMTANHAPGMKIVMIMNTAESLDDGFGSASEVARTLGFGDPVALSTETGLGMNDLYQVLRPLFEQQHMLLQTVQGTDESNEEESKLPLQLEQRVLVGPEAGLTRDSVRVEFKFEGRTIYMVDTAGWLQRTKSEKAQVVNI